MQKIFKYQLANHGVRHIEMPIDAVILSVREQNNIACLWALVDTSKQLENRVFDIYVTGEEITVPEQKRFIGTVLLNNGDFVVHVFEIINP